MPKDNCLLSLKVQHLEILGGKDLKSVTGRILKATLTNELAKKFCLTGRGKCSELGLQNTKVLGAVYGNICLI